LDTEHRFEFSVTQRFESQIGFCLQVVTKSSAICLHLWPGHPQANNESGLDPANPQKCGSLKEVRSLSCLSSV